MKQQVQFDDVKGEAILKAEMAKIAYEDGPTAKKHFKALGYTGHKFIDHDGAQAHCVWNKEEFVLCCRGTEPTEESKQAGYYVSGALECAHLYIF